MKRIITIATICCVISGAVLSAPFVKSADTASEVESIPTRDVSYMTTEEYEELGFYVEEPELFSEADTNHPLEGYQPSILNELYIGSMNHETDYRGSFVVAQDVESATSENLNLNNMDNNTIGGSNAYYVANDDIESQCMSTIGLIPGDISDESSSINKEVIIENRIFYDDSTGNSRQRLVVYAEKDGSLKAGAGTYITLASDDDWIKYITVRHQNGFLAMAVGDYDGDDKNEVAVHVPNGQAGYVYFYEPKAQSDGTYDLVKDGEFNIVSWGNRFKWDYDECRPMVNLTTTSMAGRDDLVVSVSLPYDNYKKACDAGVTGVISYQNGSYSSVFHDPMVIGNEEARFKLQSSTNADLDGDGDDEIVVIGFKNYGYTNGEEDGRGKLYGNQLVCNVLLWNGSKYYWAWNDANVKELSGNSALDIDSSNGNGDSENAPVTLTAGKYMTNTDEDIIFCEGAFFRFSPDYSLSSEDDSHIKGGSFSHNSSEDLVFSDDDNVFIGQCATGRFVSSSRDTEQLVVVSGDNALGGDTCNLDVTWFYEDSTKTKITQSKTNKDYFDNCDEDDNGTCLCLATLNMDDDSAYIKLKEKVTGWSEPTLNCILLSAPYWEELDGTVGNTTYNISYNNTDSVSHSGYIGMNFYAQISGEVKILGNGGSFGIDFNAVGAYTHTFQESHTQGTSVSYDAEAGKDHVVVTVVPIVNYCYEVILADGTKSDMISQVTLTPASKLIELDDYLESAEKYNAAHPDSDNPMLIIDTDKLYKNGYTSGDPSTYPQSLSEIASLNNDKGTIQGATVEVGQGDGTSITISVTESEGETKSNGFKLDLSAGWVDEVSGGLDIGLIVAKVQGKFFTRLVGGYAPTWSEATSTGATYSGKVKGFTDELGASNYAYHTSLVKWEPEELGSTAMILEDGEKLYEYVPVIGYVVSCHTTPPKLAENLSITETGLDYMVLNWDNPEESSTRPDVKSYLLYSSKTKNGTYEPVQVNGADVVIDGDVTSYKVTGLDSAQNYFFKLQSCSETDADGVKSVLTDAVFGRTTSSVSSTIEPSETLTENKSQFDESTDSEYNQSNGEAMKDAVETGDVTDLFIYVCLITVLLIFCAILIRRKACKR